MDREFADRCPVEVDGVPSETIKSINLNSTDTKTAVTTVSSRKRRAIGFTAGVPVFTGSIDAYIPKGELEIDWMAWMLSKARKDISYEDGDDGLRYLLKGVVVNSVGEKKDEAGEFMFSVDIAYLDRIPE